VDQEDLAIVARGDIDSSAPVDDHLTALARVAERPGPG
jgi:hypothetical protein